MIEIPYDIFTKASVQKCYLNMSNSYLHEIMCQELDLGFTLHRSVSDTEDLMLHMWKFD